MKQESDKREKQNTPDRLRRLWEFVLCRSRADARKPDQQPKHERNGVGPEVLK